MVVPICAGVDNQSYLFMFFPCSSWDVGEQLVCEYRWPVPLGLVCYRNSQFNPYLYWISQLVCPEVQLAVSINGKAA